METEVIVTVQATNDVELARKVRAIRRIAAEPIELPAPAATEETAPPPAVAARPTGLIDVGEAAGKRGEDVRVQVRGHCDTPVMGFAITIGFESLDLQFQSVEWAPVWGDRAEVLAADWRDRDHPAAGNAGPHVVLSIARFDIRSTEPGAVGADAGETLSPVQLVQGSLLATVIFRIRESTKVGKVLRLLNRTRLFGHPKVIAEFTTLDVSAPNHRAMGPSVEPELSDGAIVVTA